MVSVCAIDCELQAEVPPVPAQLLRKIPSGSYTALRAEGPAFKVIGLHKHLQRLKDSLLWILQSDGKTRDQYAHCDVLLDDSPGSARRLWRIVSPTMRVAADSAMQQNPECMHWMVFLHICMADAHEGRLKTTVYVKPLAHSADDSVAVAILGPPRAEVPARSIPAAKGSQWASDRMVHERQLPEGTSEGILCNSNNALLEGLITNIFVVTEAEGQAVLQTSHPSQGILDGVSRRLIIQACTEAGVKCLEDAPLWEQRYSWVQAFTCNSVAGVRMISSMMPAWDNAAPAVSFSTKPCPVVQSIMTAFAGIWNSKTESLLSDTL